MPIDPIVPLATSNTGARAADRIAALERQVAAIERRFGEIPMTAGAPTAPLRDGSLQGDSANLRLWLRVNGLWYQTPLSL